MSGAPALEPIRRDWNLWPYRVRSGVSARLFSGAPLSDFTCIYTIYKDSGCMLDTSTGCFVPMVYETDLTQSRFQPAAIVLGSKIAWITTANVSGNYILSYLRYYFLWISCICSALKMNINDLLFSFQLSPFLDPAIELWPVLISHSPLITFFWNLLIFWTIIIFLKFHLNTVPYQAESSLNHINPTTM